MTGLLIKLLICPAIIFLSDILFKEVYFPSFYGYLFIGMILAATAHLLEVFILKPGTLWRSTLIDFAAAFALVYMLSAILPGVSVSMLGAVNTALLFLFSEYALHLWLIWRNKTRKA